ncbi:hypothetical protein TSUD_20490 [Trifolium subterraneum]|uniref:Uncharacterized protein n=1 Tax=Trifolium subterraneum TaxID=3900 RepID=A0A2Z6NCH0_TRISU|nr:hypothetical protein TSUD_20490 [Trifolium subterraneum]
MASSIVSSIIPISSFQPKLQRFPLRASAATPATHKARFVARRKESVSVQQLQRPLIEYMSLPASQYSVLDAERIERVSEDTFRCYVYTIKFFTFEVSIEIPFAFKAIPKQAIESAGTQVLEQILKIMLPRFMSQKITLTENKLQRDRGTRSPP